MREESQLSVILMFGKYSNYLCVHLCWVFLTCLISEMLTSSRFILSHVCISVIYLFYVKETDLAIGLFTASCLGTTVSRSLLTRSIRPVLIRARDNSVTSTV